jgi:hypothetical protein
LHITDVYDILVAGETQKCQQKRKKKQTVCGSSVFLRITGTRLIKNGGKNTPPVKKKADVPAAAGS